MVGGICVAVGAGGRVLVGAGRVAVGGTFVAVPVAVEGSVGVLVGLRVFVGLGVFVAVSVGVLVNVAVLLGVAVRVYCVGGDGVGVGSGVEAAQAANTATSNRGTTYRIILAPLRFAGRTT